MDFTRHINAPRRLAGRAVEAFDAARLAVVKPLALGQGHETTPPTLGR
jgi:hypothetical protein